MSSGKQGKLYALLDSRNAVLTQGRTYRGSRRRLACGDLQLNQSYYFLCHFRCTSLAKMW